MSVDDVLEKLQAKGLILKDQTRNGNDSGYQLRFTKGEIVNVFDNGTITAQGKNQPFVRWDLDPLILDQLPSEGQTQIEKLEKYTQSEVGFAVVLATPDDEGHVVGQKR